MADLAHPPLPYCGRPVVPEELLTRWNLDPVLMGLLVFALVVYVWAARRRCRPVPQTFLFIAGWALASFAVISPLCPMSVSLAAARIGQHMLLTLLAAPLVAAGLSGWKAPAPAGFTPPRKPRPGEGVWAAALLFAGFLWFWHAPAPYAATFANPTIYWAMHASLFGCALWLWLALLADRNPLRCVAATVFTSIQMSLLGAVIALASHPFYTPHLFTTAAWGLSPLQDQEIGGAIMWVPGGVVFLAFAMVQLASVLNRSGEGGHPGRPAGFRP